MDADIDRLVAKAPDWSLGDDSALCSLLGRLSTQVTSRCNQLEERLNQIHKKTGQLDASVMNINVDISILANTKFIEVKVDEDDTPHRTTTHEENPIKSTSDVHADIVSSVGFAVSQGLALVRNHFDEVTREGLDDNQPSIYYLPKDDFNLPMPSLIGSDEFFSSSKYDVIQETSQASILIPESINRPPTVPHPVVPPFVPVPPPPPTLTPSLPVSSVIDPLQTTKSGETQVQSSIPIILPKPKRSSLFDDSSESDSDVVERTSPMIRPISTEDSLSTRSRNSFDSKSIAQSEEAPVNEEVKHIVASRPPGVVPVPSASDIMAAAARLGKKPSEKNDVTTKIKQNETVKPSVLPRPSNGAPPPAAKLPDLPVSMPSKPASVSSKPLVAPVSIEISKQQKEEAKPREEIVKKAPTIIKKPVHKSLFDSDSDGEDLFKPIQKVAPKKISIASTTSAKSEKETPKAVVTKTTQEKVETPAAKQPSNGSLPAKKTPTTKYKSLFDSDSDGEDLFRSLASSRKGPPKKTSVGDRTSPGTIHQEKTTTSLHQEKRPSAVEEPSIDKKEASPLTSLTSERESRVSAAITTAEKVKPVVEGKELKTEEVESPLSNNIPVEEPPKVEQPPEEAPVKEDSEQKPTPLSEPESLPEPCEPAASTAPTKVVEEQTTVKSETEQFDPLSSFSAPPKDNLIPIPQIAVINGVYEQESPPPFVSPTKSKSSSREVSREVSPLSSDHPSSSQLPDPISDSSPDHPRSDSEEMPGKLSNSAFASMLNSKLAMGPPPMTNTRKSKTAEDTSPSTESCSLPGSTPSATLPRMGGLQRRMERESQTTRDEKAVDEKPRLLTNVVKDRVKGPARRPPTKRPGSVVQTVEITHEVKKQYPEAANAVKISDTAAKPDEPAKIAPTTKTVETTAEPKNTINGDHKPVERKTSEASKLLEELRSSQASKRAEPIRRTIDTETKRAESIRKSCDAEPRRAERAPKTIDTDDVLRKVSGKLDRLSIEGKSGSSDSRTFTEPLKPEPPKTKKKDLFDTDSEEEAEHGPPPARSLVKREFKTVEMKQERVQTKEPTSTAGTTNSRILKKLPVRKGLFDDSDDDDLSLFKKK